MKIVVGTVAAALALAPALAQTVTPSPPPTGAPPISAPTIGSAAPAPITVGAAESSTLRTGTPVALRLSQELTTKNKQLRVGQHFNLETTEPVLIGSQTVVPAGTPAVGEITSVRNKGMWGKSGHFAAQLLYLTVAGRSVRLNGTFDDKGHAGGGAAAATSALVFLPAGFFMTGTSARMPVGAPVTGFIGEDVPVAFADAAPTPLVVPAVAPSSVATQPATAATPAPKPAN